MSPSTDGRMLRRALIAVGAIGITGTSLDLVMERHWDNLEQLIPWPALAALAVAVALIAVRPSASRLRIARVLCLAVCLLALVGVWRHVTANYEAAPLDFRFAARWDAISEPVRWWLAATKTVGPSPPLAPGVLAQAALALLAAAHRHPVSVRAN